VSGSSTWSRCSRSWRDFFLALLLNLPDRPRILELVRRRFPHAPADASVLRWLTELSTGEESEKSGIALNEGTLELVGQLLQGRTVEQVRATLEGQGFDCDDLPEIVGELKGSLFKPLFIDP
jgi:hypothetical protein